MLITLLNAHKLRCQKYIAHMQSYNNNMRFLPCTPAQFKNNNIIHLKQQIPALFSKFCENILTCDEEE